MIQIFYAIFNSCLSFLQMGYDYAKFKGKKEEDSLMLAMEGKLRQAFENFHDELLSKTVELEKAQNDFMSQVIARIQSLSPSQEQGDAMECDGDGSGEEMPKIKLVSLDVSKASVHELLKQEAGTGSIAHFLEKVLDGTSSDYWANDHFKGECFVDKTHVTMLFAKEASQAFMKNTFGPLLGATVDLQATALLWDSQVAALEVSLSTTTREGKEMPTSHNEFVHITVWVAEGAQARMSNQLPSSVKDGVGQRVPFATSAPLLGTVSFWDLENNQLPIP
jgi:Fungal tRNA ligase phosphodiesterase domain